jgi:MYXO-CTERM domain-containing protein
VDACAVTEEPTSSRFPWIWFAPLAAVLAFLLRLLPARIWFRREIERR